MAGENARESARLGKVFCEMESAKRGGGSEMEKRVPIVAMSCSREVPNQAETRHETGDQPQLALLGP